MKFLSSLANRFKACCLPLCLSFCFRTALRHCFCCSIIAKEKKTLQDSIHAHTVKCVLSFLRSSSTCIYSGKLFLPSLQRCVWWLVWNRWHARWWPHYLWVWCFFLFGIVFCKQVSFSFSIFFTEQFTKNVPFFTVTSQKELLWLLFLLSLCWSLLHVKFPSHRL